MLDPRLAGLLDTAAYEPRPAAVELRETHISWVLLAGDAAYKIKKPLKLAFSRCAGSPAEQGGRSGSAASR